MSHPRPSLFAPYPSALPLPGRPRADLAATSAAAAHQADNAAAAPEERWPLPFAALVICLVSAGLWGGLWKLAQCLV